MSPVNYNFKKGVDAPSWHWLSFFPAGPSYHGSANTYDGKRYIYWAIQYGTTSAAASTTALYRYCTWTNAWQYLFTTTNAGMGLDVEYDNSRNVLYLIHGAGLATWQIFNLNTTAVTVANASVPAWSVITGPALPVAASYGASLSMPDDTLLPTQIDTGTADATGNTTTVVKATDATGTFGAGMVGLALRVTSGTQSGQIRTVSAVTDKNTLTLGWALPGALAAGDTFVIEPLQATASAGTTTTLTGPTGSTWITNQYTDHDVIIVSGMGAGQRRRIASNTANVLTLAAAVTGNARTGAFATAPDATSVFKIVPSDDFLYYQPGNGSTALYRIDVVQTTGSAWSASLATAPAAIGPGSNTFWPAAYAPGYLLAFRGAAAANGPVLMFNIGTKTWTTLTTFSGSETFTTGNSSAMLTGKRKIVVQKEGQVRLLTVDLLTGVYEPFANLPYAAPGVYDGKRMRYIKTADGVEWLYVLRAGGQEFYRVPVEWM